MKKFWSTLYRLKAHHVLLWAGYFAFWNDVLCKILSIADEAGGNGWHFISFSSPYPSTSPSIIFFLNFCISAGTACLCSCSVSIVLASLGLSVVLYFMLAPYVPEIASNPSSVFQIAILSIALWWEP